MRFGTSKGRKETSPGSPVVKILCFLCRGHGFSGLGTKIPHASWCSQKKKKDKKPKVRQDIKLEMEKQMFEKQTFAGPCKDNGTQRGL